MKLKQYLKDNDLSQREFVKVVLQKANKLIPQTTLSKYILETRIPTKDNMKAITIATDQEVQPNDFYSD